MKRVAHPLDPPIAVRAGVITMQRNWAGHITFSAATIQQPTTAERPAAVVDPNRTFGKEFLDAYAHV